MTNKTTSNTQRRRMRPAHCIQVAVGWNGIPQQIHLCFLPGVISFFSGCPLYRERAVYFDTKVVPGGTEEAGGKTPKEKQNSSPGDSTTCLLLFRLFMRGGGHEDGGVDRGYCGIRLLPGSMS